MSSDESPINTLPPELLSEIFIHYCSFSNTIRRRANVPALTLAAVDERWRAVALGTPALWSRLYICLARELSRQQELLLSTMLARAREHPLHIHLSMPRTGSKPVWELLASKAHSWHTMHLDTDVLVPQTFNGIDYNRQHEDLFSTVRQNGGVPMLRHLTFHYGIVNFGHAPSLRSLTFYIRGYSDEGEGSTFLPWTQLTSLKFCAMQSISEVLWALESSPRLERFEGDYGDLQIAEGEIRKEPLTSGLRHFAFAEGFANVCKVLEVLTLPCLETFDLSVDMRTGARNRPWPMQMLEDLLGRSRFSLKALSLRGVNISSDELIMVLRMLPTVEKLAVHERDLRCSLNADEFPPVETIDQRLLTELTKDLSLAGVVEEIDFRVTGRGFPDELFGEMLFSRRRMLKRVSLKIYARELTRDVFDTLWRLQCEGMDLEVEDSRGCIIRKT